jgi:predicted transcriptional regulator
MPPSDSTQSLAKSINVLGLDKTHAATFNFVRDGAAEDIDIQEVISINCYNRYYNPMLHKWFK